MESYSIQNYVTPLPSENKMPSWEERYRHHDKDIDKRKSDLKSCIFDSFLVDNESFDLVDECIIATPSALTLNPDEISTIGTISIGLKTPYYDLAIKNPSTSSNEDSKQSIDHNLFDGFLHYGQQLNYNKSSESIIQNKSDHYNMNEHFQSPDEQLNIGRIDCSPILFDSRQSARPINSINIDNKPLQKQDEDINDSCNFLSNELLSVLDSLYHDKSQISGTTFECTEVSSGGLDNLVDVCADLIHSEHVNDDNATINLMVSSGICFDNSIFEMDDIL